MGVQLFVRLTLALIRRRAAAAVAGSVDTASESQPLKGKKSTFTVDGKPLSEVLFDPDDPEQAAPYPDEIDGEGERERRCTLCLGARRDAAATECGHVCKFGVVSMEQSCRLMRNGCPLHSLLGVHCRMGKGKGVFLGPGSFRPVPSSLTRLVFCFSSPSVHYVDRVSLCPSCCQSTTCKIRECLLRFMHLFPPSTSSSNVMR